MDERYYEIVRQKIRETEPFEGLEFYEAARTTEITDQLLADYENDDPEVSQEPAFRLAAVHSTEEEARLTADDREAISTALRNRLSRNRESPSGNDLEIALGLHRHDSIKNEEIEDLVDRLEGVDNFAVMMRFREIIAIIGTKFLKPYLLSDELWETEGMGGPQRPMLREEANEALRWAKSHRLNS